ncbi:MAG: MurR/RpiR family transcriptional regulator [Pseudomonadota bacterium]
MAETLNRLNAALHNQIDQMPAQMQAAAKYIIDHPGDFGIEPVRVTASKIGVSSNVLVRLAHRMGFDGFEAFRKPFRHALMTEGEDRLGRDWLDHMRKTGGFATDQAELAQNELNVVTRSLRLMDAAKAQDAIRIILRANRCFVTATRASYALAYYFHYTGHMAHSGLHLIPRHMGSAIDDLLDVNAHDCLLAITVQPYSSDTIRAIRFARETGARIVLISDSDVIAPGIQVDVTFQISTNSLHHFSSYTGAMAVLECLIGHLFTAGGDAARSRVEAYEKSREETGAYWQPSKLPRLRRKS